MKLALSNYILTIMSNFHAMIHEGNYARLSFKMMKDES